MRSEQLLELSPYLALTILFVAPFVDPRRPFRLLHLDVLVLSSFGLYSIALLDRGPLFASIRWSTVIATLGLLYILVRSGYAVLRPTRAEPGELTRVPLRWLKWGIFVLMVFRLLFPFADDRLVIDVGLASVAGAEQILAGEDLYGAESYRYPELHPDTYGPVNYLLYVPFTWAISSAQHAARAATNAFDLATLAGVILLGRHLGGRRHGRALGLLLGYAWATSPYAFFASVWAYNDMLVPLAVVFALMGAASPWARGTSLGLGAAIKFVPALLWPLVLCAPGGTPRSRILAGLGSVGLTAALFALFIPDGGVRELYDRTVGWQLSRDSTISLWGQFDAITSFRPLAVGFVAVLALLGGVVARKLTLFQLVAFAVAVIVAFQLSLAHWLPSYIVWFAPLFLVTLVGATDPERSGDEEPSRPASDRQAEQERADPDDRPVSPGALAEHG
ncbi:MAG: DUF2029 domain-containing protein [Actinobacteria bacterium]|nr:DUF2029 domain-containing protein [Actinomycetota bacterium]